MRPRVWSVGEPRAQQPQQDGMFPAAATPVGFRGGRGRVAGQNNATRRGQPIATDGRRLPSDIVLFIVVEKRARSSLRFLKFVYTAKKKKIIIK